MKHRGFSRRQTTRAAGRSSQSATIAPVNDTVVGVIKTRERRMLA
jgi:hypothetical protein